MSSAKSHHVHPNSKSLELLQLADADHSLTDDATKKALQDINSKLISLGDLAGQLGGFVGESDVVKKAVKNALDILTEQQNKCRNSENNRPTFIDCKDAPNCHDITQQIEKLEKFNTQLKTPNDNPKKLLENLCDGLEKFLGFNKDSEGYNGSGIVYSDLDRLCDGVMGFLSGVLSAVKNENEVTTYDKYISDENNKLEKVLEEVNKKIGTGRDGLAVSVDAVKEWLEKYNDEVETLTTAVTSELGKLSAKLSSGSGDYYKFVKRNERLELVDQLEIWKNIMSKISETLNNIEHDNVNFLDNSLKHKIKSELKPIQKSVQVLWKSAENGPYVEQVSHVEKTLEEQKRYVKDSVREEGNKLQHRLDEEFRNIGQHVKSLEQLRAKEFMNVKDRLKEAEDFMHSSFDNAYKNKIGGLFEVLRKAFAEVDKSMNPSGNKTKSMIREEFERIKTFVDALKIKLRGCIGSLDSWMTKTKSFIGAARLDVDKIVEKKVGEDNNLRLQKIAADLQTNIVEPLNTFMKDIEGEVAMAVQGARWHFEKIKGEVGEKTRKGLLKDWNTLKQDIEGLVTGLVNKGPTKVGKLQDIVGNVKSYVARVGNGFDGDALKNWATEIVEKDETVRQRIRWYANHGGNRNALSGKKFDDVKNAIISALPNFLKSAISNAALAAGLRTDGQLSDIAVNFEKFSKMCQHELQGDDKLRLAAESIENDAQLNVSIKEHPYSNNFLKQAVKNIILSFSVSAQNFANEIQAFIQQYRIGELDDAIESINSINRKVVTEEPGKAIESALTNVNTQISHLGTSLEEIKKSVHGLNVNATEDALKTFSTQITQNLNGLLNDISDYAKRGVRWYLDNLEHGNIDTMLTEVKVKIEALENSSDTAVATIVKAMEPILTSLEDIPHLVDLKQDEAKQRMNELDATFRSHVHFIDAAFNNANTALTYSIQHVQEALNAAFDASHKAVALLKKTLCAAVEKAFLKTTLEIRKLFADERNANVASLQVLLDEQISAIQNIIATDSASGLKGLLSRMRGENQYALEKIEQNSHAVINFSDVLRNYFYFLFWFIEGQVKSSPSSQLVAGLQTRTYALLTHLHDNNRTFTFDSGFRSLLHDLTSALSTFDPATFANPNHPQLLDALKAGMKGLVGEMEKAYVNRYCGKTITWKVIKDQKVTEELTDDAKRCAKVFMSCLRMLLNDLSKVKERCGNKGEWNQLKINLHPTNKLGSFFKSCGYSVATDVPLQNGELQNSSKMKGEHIHKIVADIKTISPDEHVPQCRSPKKTHNFDMIDYIICLANHLHQYYTVNHYATFTSTKHPSNINDMLQWLTGLPHSPVYLGLTTDGFSDLFEKSEDADAKKLVLGDIPIETEDDVTLDAYPEKINVAKLSGVLTEVCHHAEETLISFLGHGHSGGIYACEFNTNSAKLAYPSDPSKCLDLLFEVIGRVYNQLFFLFKQCSYRTTLGGWYDCWYGQGVGGSAWNCNTLQCPGQRGEQKADQKHEQKCNQNCDQTADCGLKSPLQSFLEDGLPGFLPHPYSKSNCKPTCTAPGHFGKVCITPMGFSDISGVASRRQQGRHIMEVLNEFCGSEHAPLSRLCGLLTCLLTRPPQTLGDMFAFYYNFLNGWKKRNYVLRATHRENAYETAVRDANFKNDDNPLDVRSMFNNTQHGDKLSTHAKGDLFGLVSCDQPMAKDTYCGRYLQPCGRHIWTVFSEKHAGNYLSWIVYLTETFNDLLKMLYDDCNNKCGQEHSKCNRTSCAVECPTKSTSESGTSSQNKYHNSKCSTIVTCKSTLPTFCRYGFVFDSPQSLYGEYGDDKKRTCKDFCRALYRVLSVVKEENDVLAKLKFDTIPNFLWAIRSKFFWTTVALWSLSLFYLLCVMVGRLDVLHIRSHLRIPSSHKITAQSLLAAAQVGRLAKISYLQP